MLMFQDNNSSTYTEVPASFLDVSLSYYFICLKNAFFAVAGFCCCKRKVVAFDFGNCLTGTLLTWPL